MNCRALLLVLAISLRVLPLFGQKDPPAGTVATVNGETISAKDLSEASGEPLAKLEQQVYQFKQEKLQEMIDDRLLAREARRRNVSLQSLMDTEITAKAAPVTAEDIHRIYELNKTQLQRPESEVADQLRSLLLEQNVATRRHEFAKSLQADSKVSIFLEPPPPFRAAVGVDGPSRGPADAQVTIVEFEDFQCPFCKKAHDTLQQVLDLYKDKVRVVHRDFPLQPLHPAAMKAHEAGRCAQEQGKFWEYRDLLYKNAPAADPEQLTTYATQLGLDSADFKKCVDSGKFKAIVQKDEAEGERLGLTGTPAFFINGRPLAGAQPESDFARIIDEELNTRAQR
jgi:protein-disulfide isomerase